MHFHRTARRAGLYLGIAAVVLAGLCGLGCGRRRLLQLPGEEAAGLAWSPDGRHLAFTARPISTSD